MPLKEYLNELNYVLMKLHDIDMKMKDEDLEMIQLAFLHLSFENCVSSLSVGKDFVALEEVEFGLYSKDL